MDSDELEEAVRKLADDSGLAPADIVEVLISLKIDYEGLADGEDDEDAEDDDETGV
jgi:hypothetical protein